MSEVMMSVARGTMRMLQTLDTSGTVRDAVSYTHLDVYKRQEKQLDFEDVVEIVYRYSREVEHSDRNLEAMEQMMEEQLIPWFSKERCKERIEGKEGKIWM